MIHAGNDADWFYIKSIGNGNVISVAASDAFLRSQVYVRPPRQNDEELWRWDGQFLVNKATNLVMDIRKGRLKLIEDTEICIYTKKPLEEAHNQLWGVRRVDGHETSVFIHSHCNADWVLDIETKSGAGDPKLILFPHRSTDNESQQWVFVSASLSPCGTMPAVRSTAATVSNDLLSEETTAQQQDAGEYFGYGLTPAKRGSVPSLTSYKECHQMVYLERNPRLSDKTIAMAAAYQTWQNWKVEQVSLAATRPDQVHSSLDPKTRARLQTMARTEAANVYEACDKLTNHKETAMALAARLVTSLIEQQPCSP